MTWDEQLIRAVQNSGFLHLDSLVHLFVGGSELHGAKVKDTDDLDIYGVYLEPPELVLGLEKQDFYVWRTAGNERRNGPDDVDVIHCRNGRVSRRRETQPLFIFYSHETMPADHG